MPGIQPKEQEHASPVPQGLDTATPGGLDVGGRIQPQDMYVASSGRDVQPTYLGDEEKDPNKPPPGCPCDKKTWKISYEDTVETTKKIHPEWAPRQVKVEAALRFRPRYRSDKASIKQEKSGERTYDADLTFTMTDDGALKYTSDPYAGWTIEDFSLREKRLTPDKYSLRDHQTSLAIQEALNNGEKSNNKKTTVVTSYYQEGEDNRDILVMEYNHETKTGTIRVISTEEEGKCHDFSTIAAMAKQEFPDFHETRPAEDIFLLTDSAVSEKQIRSAILKAESDTTDANMLHQSIRADDRQEGRESKGEPDVVVEQAVSLPLQNKTMRVSDAIVGDTIQTVDYVRRSLQQEFKMLTTTLRLNADQKMPKKPVVLPPFLQRLLGIFEERKNTEEGKKETKFHEDREYEISDWQAQGLLETVEETWETMVGAKEVIAFAVDPETQGVAIPAAILALDILAHPEMIMDEAIQEIRDENQVVPLTEKEWEAVVVFLMSDDEEILPLESTNETETGSNIEHIDMTVLTWMKELMQRIYEEPVEQAIETIEYEEEVALLQMGELWRILIMRAQEFPVSDDSSEVYLVRVQEDETPEIRKQVEQFSFALTLWTLLKLDGYYRSLRSLKTFIMGETKRVNIIEKLKQRVPEGLIQREPAQWILLAIIWHLAMIREQGAIQVTDNKQPVIRKTKTKKKLQTPYIPRGGVIFAYAT